MSSQYKMHECKEMDPETAGFAKVHGYTRKELPLRVTTKTSANGTTIRNEFCPYCAEPTSDMENLPAADAALLNTNIRGRGSSNAPASTLKTENTLLKQQLREAVRAELAAQQEQKQQKGEKKKGDSE